jgi:hypothetical protein
MKEKLIELTIGELILREKYKFIPEGLINEIVRDTIAIIEVIGC